MISKSICNVFNEDAIIISRLFPDKKITMLGVGERYLKLTFPTKMLNNIIKEIKTRISGEVATIENLDTITPNIKFHTTKYYQPKSRFVKEDDVFSYIQDKIDDKNQDFDFVANEIQRGVKKDYQLHTKTIEFYKTSFPQLFYPLMTRQFFCDFHVIGCSKLCFKFLGLCVNHEA